MEKILRILGFNIEKVPRSTRERPEILLALAVAILVGTIYIFFEWARTGGFFSCVTGLFGLVAGIAGVLLWKELRFGKNK